VKDREIPAVGARKRHPMSRREGGAGAGVGYTDWVSRMEQGMIAISFLALVLPSAGMYSAPAATTGSAREEATAGATVQDDPPPPRRTLGRLGSFSQLDYLGQSPPGREFVRFAPDIVPEDMYHSVTVSPDRQEIYWAELNGTAGTRIMVTRVEGDHWTSPEAVSFAGVPSGEYWDDAPVVSPDNSRLFFNSLRPLASGGETRWRFWYADRVATGWSEPVPLPEVVNSTGGIHWGASVSSSGTLYFGVFSGGGPQIYYSQLSAGEYTTPMALGAVNSLGDVICPFVAPDESYIIFNKIEGGQSVGYYISFKDTTDEWLPPVQAVGFPSPSWESSFVSRDGRYVFCKAYWASAQIIEDLRPRVD
jgi:hypothetical protein